MSATCGYCLVHLAEGGVEFHWRQSLEAQRDGGETLGWPAYHHPSASAFSGSASYTVRLMPFGSLFNTCVCPYVHSSAC